MDYGYDITVQDELVVSVDGDYDTYDAFEQACGDAFQDEFGVRPNHSETGDALLEIVAVPDDVAEALPSPGSFVLLACSSLLAMGEEVPE